MKLTLADRIKLALEGPPKKTQAALAKACGVSAPSVNGWTSGESKTLEAANLLKAAAFLEVSPKWLAEGVGPMRQNSSVVPPSDEFVSVRHADVAFSNGTGQVVYHEDDRPPLMFRADFLRKLGIAQGNAVVVDSAGNSNEPRIVDGSVVLVNRGDKERLDGDFFAFRFDGELMIKRLEHVEGVGILATAENPNFKPKQKIYRDFDPNSFEVIGRAVWTGSTL